jgi:hypothetical protein
MKYLGTGGTAVLNFFYIYYQFPFLLSLPKNRNYPSQASHFGVKPAGVLLGGVGVGCELV